MQNKSLSTISLFAMIAVVWWHCNCGSQVELWFIPAFCVWSVPWFFFLSGVLFRRTLETKPVLVVARIKLKTLVFPYLIWCCIGAIITLRVSQWDGINALLCLSRTRIHPWGNSALWYVRTLIIFMILTSITHFAFNRFIFRLRPAVVAIVSFALIVATSRLVMSLGPASCSLYFIVGYIVSREVFANKSSSRASFIVGMISLIIAAFFRGAWFSMGYSFRHNGATWLGNLSSAFIIVGLLNVIPMLPLSVAKNRIIAACLPLTAIVYFMHYPINNLLKYYSVGMDHDVVFVTLLIFAPTVYFGVAWCLKRYGRKMYNILSGGR